MRPALFVGGPPRHGVVRYSRDLARVALASTVPTIVVESLDALVPGRPTHLHFTDRLFGESPDRAATAFEELAAIVPLAVTLHDVPQASDGAGNLARRADCYRRVTAAARGVVCNSSHELAFLDDLGIVETDPRPQVIPLGAPPVSRAPREDAFDSVVALVGFVYPGKGHREVVEAVARLRGGVDGGLDVVALGAASAGHDADVVALADHAARLGVSFTTTGFLPDDELLDRCARAAVPIAAHQHVSASGSILAWLAAGRRPLVVDSRYSREMAGLRPGTLTVYAPDGMDAAITAALDDPGSTLLPPTCRTAPHLTESFAAYARWWEAVRWW